MTDTALRARDAQIETLTVGLAETTVEVLRLRAERDKLVRGLAGAAYTTRGRRVWCKVCETFRQFGHRPDCPVAEAERLLAGKETV